MIVFLMSVLPLTCAGTLILIIPTSDGLVVAADSRVFYPPSTFCDNVFKITEVSRPDRTVIVAANLVTDLDSSKAPKSNFCDYLASAPRRLDMLEFAKTYLESGPVRFEMEDFADLSSKCASEMQRFRSRFPEDVKPDPLGGDALTVLAIAHFDPVSRLSTVVSFKLVADEKGDRVRVSDLQIDPFEPESVSPLITIGDDSSISEDPVKTPS